MLKNPEISQEDFEKLLDWLNPNREKAAEKYEAIRCRLIKVFEIKKHFDAEHLADLVMDRVCRKLSEIIENYEGRKELYFYGVAKKVHFEAVNKAKKTEAEIDHLTLKSIEEEEETSNIYYQCLEECLKKLDPDERKLVIGYYQNYESGKIDYRRKIAQKLDISMENLRIKIFRLRNEIKKCILKCVKKS